MSGGNLVTSNMTVTYNGILLDAGTTVWHVSEPKGWMRPDPNPFPRIRLFRWLRG